MAIATSEFEIALPISFFDHKAKGIEGVVIGLMVTKPQFFHLKNKL